MNTFTMNNQTSFKSNIKFITSKEFQNKNFANFFYCAAPCDTYERSFYKGKQFWTGGIRTCTAGGVVDAENGVGFHIFSNESEKKKTKKNFISTLMSLTQKPLKSALLIGSKQLKFEFYSIPVFEIISNSLKKFVIPSEFKTFTDASAEADIAYDSAEDTWYINTNYPMGHRILCMTEDITTLEDLKTEFESIKIAPQDRLFIGDKEVTREEAPELFI